MRKFKLLSTLFIVFILLGSNQVNACTGIRLISKDGGVVYGRTMEWGSFDLHSRIAIIPRGYTNIGLTPDGNNGKTYISKYGVVALDMVNKDFIGDGMNEKGLALGMFYHPGFAKYPDYDKKNAANCISSQELANYILLQFATVDEVIEGMKEVTVVGVIEDALGILVQAHWMVTDPTGRSIVIEFTDSKLKIYEAPLGVITNSPNYDWHMTNLRNNVNLSKLSFPEKKLSGIEFGQLGAGTGMLGLPGDNTPPSRFIRAVAWSQTARELENSTEAVYETFRVLDNFQLPSGPGAAEGHGESESEDFLRSSTLWTTAWNLTDLKLNYHTQHNRRVRQLDLKKIDFSKIGTKIIHIPLDEKKEQDIKEILPKL